jgi:hypothetical protein
MPSRVTSPSGQVQELVWGALAAQVTIVLAQLGVATGLWRCKTVGAAASQGASMRSSKRTWAIPS